ncbi:Protein CBG09106 [Caenorhabditis briggsae]|uniref:Protein CBG09106 n=1 Tax=Caenorhabditis briggsae TaxID=6238 RepID=A8X7S5_CAEBR|nr:Protein CBG09106 [Caenorhabditis briggsae]CAP28686.1 Protein CBG09106 [Caenorhabditis briggsae]
MKVVTLASHENLLTASCELLNSEWPRSMGSREHSQKKSCRESPPMSFLLLDSDEKLIGHARICKLPNRSKMLAVISCFCCYSLLLASILIFAMTAVAAILDLKSFNLIKTWPELANKTDDEFDETERRFRSMKQTLSRESIMWEGSFVMDGTTVITDCWRGYNGLAALGYDHKTVNHSQNFVDPATGLHTQRVESLWSHLKRRIKPKCGLKGDLWDDHWFEALWHFKHHEEAKLYELWAEIARRYPLT